MIRNYLKISIRNVFKHRLHSGILIAGLTLGMTACLLLLQYVSYEWRFDTFHTKANRIYRVINERFQEGQSVQLGTITYPTIGPTMAREFPEVAGYTRLAFSPELIVAAEDKMQAMAPVLWADEHFFELFDFPLLARENATLLQAPNEVAISQSMANRYFGTSTAGYEEVIGRELRIDNYDHPFRIVGVFADVPANSHLQFELLLSYSSTIRYWGAGANDSWTWSDFYHYLLLEPGTDVTALEAKFADFSERHFQGSEVSGSNEVFRLQPVLEAHLYSTELEYEIGKTSSGRTIWILLGVALSLLVIAWINYVNLSSVRAIERSREVGIRKIVGANKSQLIGQFLSEAALINLISLSLALGLVYLLTPFVVQWTGVDRTAISYFADNQLNGGLLFSLLGLVALGVVASGTYPAFLLAAPRLATVFQGKFAKDPASNWLRKGLVVFQFTVSIGLIAATILMHRQLNFMMEQDLGIRTDQVVTLRAPQLTNWDSTFINRMNTLKTELRQLPEVENATTSSRVPGEQMARNFDLQRSDAATESTTYMSNVLQVDQDFAHTYGLDVLAGRFFRPTDHNVDGSRIDKVVVNTQLAELLGWGTPEQAVNQSLRIYGRDWQIVGVLSDFHQRSLHHAIEPLILFPMYGNGHALSLQLNTPNLDQTLAQIKATYQSVFPGNVFEYEVLDQQLNQLYRSDILFRNALQVFMILTIIIACLGLLGLASYTIFLRTKEIGIRKVLGASTSNIVKLLSREFLQLVILAVVLSIPLAYYGMQRWLQRYAYRIEIDGWVFLWSALAALLIAGLTIGYQAFRAAANRPVEALRKD